MIDKKQAQENGLKIIDSSATLTEQKNEKLEQLKKLIPNLVNSDNQFNTQALQDFIDIANTTSNNKGYELTFAGKGIARAKADSETTKELQVEPQQSKDFDTTQNAVIRGDNLEVLKILKQNYFETIKMIYIDPPYNTKSENFIYNDNFKESEGDLLKTYGLDEEEDKDTLNFLENVYGTRSHSGWLAFMYPRLKLARDLLKEDGVIFISIDDNEQANLKIICDEIFGEDNFINSICIKVKDNSGESGGGEDKKLKKNIEHLLFYCKNRTYYELPKVFKISKLKDILRIKDNKYVYSDVLISTSNKKFLKTIKDGQGNDIDIFTYSEFEKKSIQQLLKEENTDIYSIYLKYYSKIYTTYNARTSIRSRVIDSLKDENFTGLVEIIYKPKSGKYKDKEVSKFFSGNTMRLWAWLSEISEKNDKQEIIIKFPEGTLWDDINTASLANEGFIKFENGKKPISLLKNILRFSKPNDLILDFFAGSGTTGDAVMQLNAEDGGSRKFILVQWDEEIDKKKNQEAYKFCTENNFKPVISSICIERLNRAGEKIKKEKQEKNGMFNNQNLDIGYKVFSLTEKPKLAEKKDENQQEIFQVENQRKETINTLYNMLCATCKPLHITIEEIIKDKLYKADDEVYVLGEIAKEKLEPYKDLKINIDGWSDISLENWLNLFGLNEKDKERVTVVY